MISELMRCYLIGYGIGVVSGCLIKMWWDLRPNKKNGSDSM